MKTFIESLRGIYAKEQWLFFYALNVLFIWKYMSRTAYHPLIGTAVFTVIFLMTVPLFQYISKKGEKTVITVLVMLLAVSTLLIAALLYKVDRMELRVDRWSATTYFLDGLFSGIYPYGIHTHVCETNFPSPSPMWFYLNIPFWLMGDVGIGLICYLFLLVWLVWWFTRSKVRTLLYTMLLLISPAYWWEVAVRSDSISNAIVIFGIILFFEKKAFSFQRHWIATAVICGLMAVTRLWAPIPPAIYLARSFFSVSHARKAAVIAIILLVMFIVFAPYIFWDTDTWVFFHRNPYMSETSTGNGWILLVMIAIALFLAFRYRDFNEYCRYTSCFLTLFFVASLFYNHIAHNADISYFEDSDFDISYLSLMLPYCLYVLSLHPHTCCPKES